MVTNISAKCKGVGVGVARFARRCWVLGSGCWRRLCAIGRICASRARFGAVAELDEQSPSHWIQSSWHAKAVGLGWQVLGWLASMMPIPPWVTDAA